MANFINLTPHTINVVGGPSLPPSGSVARVAATSTPAGEFGGVALSRTTFGEVEGLPAPEEGVLLVVSALVRSAVPDRRDVASPGDLVRGDDGQPIGCRGLIIN